MSTLDSGIRHDRIAGVMFGAAIGDALGSAFEMLQSDVIVRHLQSTYVSDYEPALRGSLLYGRGLARPTDDTAMALSVAFALARRQPLTPDLFAQAFLADLEPGSGSIAEMFWTGGPGGATTRALRRLKRGAPAASNGHVDDGGNGAAMRAHPVGCLDDRDEVLRVAAMQAKVTHGHPAAVAAAQAVAVLVHAAIVGQPTSSALPHGISDQVFAAEWHRAHQVLVAGDGLPTHLRNAAMSGWATVSAAHAISLIHEGDPERAIGAAAASGGDTDTIASIVGALVGARCGLSSLPSRWLAGLSPDASLSCSTAASALATRGDKAASQSTEQVNL
jgi:ADP-ribosylglycohydrolase